MKASSATSARASQAPRPTDPSSGKRRPTPTTAEDFALEGRSQLPDPQFNAYRKDLADITLAGRVIASHYAKAVERVIGTAAELRSEPSESAEIIARLKPGDAFALVDDSLGWSWGYAGPERRVGYVRSTTLDQH